MSEERPLWRQGFDVVERALAPRLEGVVHSERFAIAVGLASQAQRTIQRRTERATRRVLHLVNLPAGSDINRILTELAQLQRQVRELSKQAGQQEASQPSAAKTQAPKPKENSGGGDDGQARPSRPRPARR